MTKDSESRLEDRLRHERIVSDLAERVFVHYRTAVLGSPSVTESYRLAESFLREKEQRIRNICREEAELSARERDSTEIYP